MLRDVESYETADGRRFDDLAKAQEHVCDAIREAIDSRLGEMQAAGKLSANERFQIVMAIVPDVIAARKLRDVLVKWMDY